MTRSQFLIVLYKKMLRPAILFIAGYYMVRFVMSLVKGEDISTWIISPLITAAAFIAFLYGMEKGIDYLLHKFPSPPVSTEDKSLKSL